MPISIQIENDIKKIENIFHSFDRNGSKKQTLEALACFEQRTSNYLENRCLSAIIKWYKNLFLQELKHFPRAEELLDDALSVLEEKTEPLLLRWKLKAYLSLSYVHQAQWNYIDAEFYLKEAAELALSDPSLSKFLGEIYSLLAMVNLNLNRHSQARKYVTLEKDISYEKYRENRSDDSSAIIYAYSLVNYSRVKRIFNLIDHDINQSLEEAISIFNKLNYEKGLLKARLEQAEFQYVMNLMEKSLETASDLERNFEEKGMYIEFIQAGLLVVKIFKTMLEYEQAEEKLNHLLVLAREQGLDQEQIMADVFFEMGSFYYDTDREADAFEYFRQSAKAGMVAGNKGVIIRTYNAARLINKYKAKELLTSDLVYQDAMFVKDRIGQSINPFTKTKTKIKLFATTLFVDIVGFSSLMKRSDEKSTVTMIDELIDRMCLVVYRHNGYIDKFLGDGFMAIFEHGPAMVQEAALNAVKAGGDIHRAINHKNRRLKKAYGMDTNINVRMGVSTGEIYAIFLGNYIKREFTYLGNSVNLASKLESMATSQLMLIDVETYNLVKHGIIAKQKRIFIAGLGETDVYQVSRLAGTEDRPSSGGKPLS